MRIAACWPYPIVSDGGVGGLPNPAGCRPPPPEADPPLEADPTGGRPLSEQNGTHLWKYYLAQNFVCGR